MEVDDLDSGDESFAHAVITESKDVKVPIIEVPSTATAQHSVAKR